MRALCRSQSSDPLKSMCFSAACKAELNLRHLRHEWSHSLTKHSSYRTCSKAVDSGGRLMSELKHRPPKECLRYEFMTNPRKNFTDGGAYARAARAHLFLHAEALFQMARIRIAHAVGVDAKAVPKQIREFQFWLWEAMVRYAIDFKSEHARNRAYMWREGLHCGSIAFQMRKRVVPIKDGGGLVAERVGCQR